MTLHYEVFDSPQADAPSVLLSSGLGGAGAYWKPQLPALRAAGYRVIVYDQRGTGRSPALLPADYSIAQMADDALSVLQATDTGACHFVGHALGGLVGLQLALCAPTRVASLALVNAWAAPNTHSARCFDARLALLEQGGAQAYVAAQPIFLYPAAWALAHSALVEAEVAHAVAHFQGEGNLRARIAALRAFDVKARLAEVGCPVWVSAAQDDVLVPWLLSEQLEQGIPHAVADYVVSGGHAHNITCADAFNRSLIGFLDRQREPQSA